MTETWMPGAPSASAGASLPRRPSLMDPTAARGSNLRGCHKCRLARTYVTWTLDCSRVKVFICSSRFWLMRSRAASSGFGIAVRSLTHVVAFPAKWTSWPGWSHTVRAWQEQEDPTVRQMYFWMGTCDCANNSRSVSCAGLIMCY